MMSTIRFDPKRLKGLGLSFEECVYALAFRLENEILQKGREEVFRELPCQEQMTENVHEVLGDACIYVLKEALGYPTTCMEEMAFNNGWWTTKKDCLETAMYRLGVDKSLNAGGVGSIRYSLLGKGQLWGQRENALPLEMKVGDEVVNEPLCVLAADLPNSFYAQLQQLMAEVRFYDKKRDQALTAIEVLLRSAPERVDLSEETAGAQEADFNLQGSVEQICWSHRSLYVLKRLGFKVMAEVVDYFADFDNFMKAEEITLWEWSVICAILRDKGLLSADEKTEVQLTDNFMDVRGIVAVDYGLHTRVANCIRHRDLYTVGDLVCFFFRGASDGWEAIPGIRELGKRSQEYLINLMRAWTIVIPPELCNPSEWSGIEALDFGLETLQNLREMQVQTIGELITACEDKNRFSGLRFINAELYDSALRHLNRYGFQCK